MTSQSQIAPDLEQTHLEEPILGPLVSARAGLAVRVSRNNKSDLIISISDPPAKSVLGDRTQKYTEFLPCHTSARMSHREAHS